MGVEPKPASGDDEMDLFLAALEKADLRERAAFLDAACGRDGPLRQRLETLLDEQANLGNFLEEPALANAHLSPITEKPGDHIGRYKLLQPIGAGGAGVVYMAEQEEPVRRRVALKVIRLGMDTPSVIARFEAERQALALMDHPNIARVFDAGATATGRPYFVMELVHGVRITEYCDRNKLPPRDRLGLFIQICHAIQHAHQKGIIHRDIKPSNILVTLHDGIPVPKVIDFGIAKATNHRLTDTTVFTQFGAFIGTPAYMSPEQAEMSGLDLDTRSDIYSLGVVLYELLTGKTPFEAGALRRAGLDECRRTIREQEPVRPSTRLETLSDTDLTTTAGQQGMEAPRLIQALSGDLDWIILKCLEKDRTRRYDTATGLALDVQNYLDDQPILARPPSSVYRWRKVLHRHRRGVAIGVVLAATLVIGTTISITQAIRATQAERRESILHQRAVEGESAARLNEYIADINLAQRSLASGNYGRAVRLLEKYRPQAGQPDLRGFEWRYLWQVSRGDEHISLTDQDGAVQSVVFSPGGDLLVIGLPDKFTVWDGRAHSPITNVLTGAASLLFSPDGKTLLAAHPASGRPDRLGFGAEPGRRAEWERGPWLGFAPGLVSVRVWNTEDWTELESLPGNTGPIALSQDGTRLATLAMNGQGVRLWDTATWKELRMLLGAQGPLCFSPDGRRLATASRDGITLWGMGAARSRVVLPNSTNLFFNGGPGPWIRPVGAMVFSPDGQWVVATRNAPSEHGNFVLGIWNVESGRDTALPSDPEHIEHTGAISALAFSPDGQVLATASTDYSIRLWDFAKRQRRAILHGHLSEVWALSFSPDGQSLISGAKDGSVKWWPVRREQTEDILAGSWQEMVAFSKDSRRLAVRDRQGTLVILDLSTRQPAQEFQVADPSDRGRFRRPPVVALSEDLGTLALIRDEGHVQLWNTESRANTTLEIPDRPVTFLALSPDARRLVTGGGFGRGLRWWDLRHGTNRWVENEASRALFSPDGSVLATFQRTNHVQLWQAATGALRTHWVSEVELRFDAAAAFSPDGRTLAVVCSDDTVRLWDTLTGQMCGACTGHKQAVSSVAFSPDGQTLATTSDDRTLKLWNVATQQELMTIRRLGGALRTVLFSPDGSLLVGRISTTLGTGGLRFYGAPLFSETDATSSQPGRETTVP